MFCEFGSVVLVNFFNLSDWFIKFNRMIKKKEIELLDIMY